jgi:hypothetical protein
LDPLGAAKDPELSFLACALDPVRAGGRIQGLLGSTIAPAHRTRLRQIRVTRHKPGRRCIVEYDFDIEGSGRSSDGVTLIGKVRAKGPDESAFYLAKALRSTGFRCDSADGIAVPEPLGVIPEFHMWLQRKVSGTSATQLIAHEKDCGLPRRIADAAHKLHCTWVPTRRRHTMADELRILRERLPLVAQEKPPWAVRIARVVEACQRLGANVAPSRPRGIHRDFYADHAIVDGPHLHLIDLDLYCWGDPALDIGNFVAHLTEQGLRTMGDPEALADHELELEERFMELVGPAAKAAVRAYAVLTLARHIHVSRRFVDRRPLTAGLLALCEERLGIASPAARARPRALTHPPSRSAGADGEAGRLRRLERG